MLMQDEKTMNEPIRIAFQNKIPINATIELLTRCNLGCEHCYIPSHTGIGLSLEQIRSILDQLHDMGTLYLLLTGGEIFLRPDIMEIVKYARIKGMRVTLFSNATCVTEKQIEELKKLHIVQFSCTIFSMNPAIHDAITGVKGSLQKTLQTMALVKKYEIPGGVKTVIMKRNLADWRAVHEYAVENGFSHIAPPNVIPKSNGDKSPLELALNFEQTRDVRQQQNECGMEEPFRKGWNDSDFICTPIHSSVFIDSSGDLYPCISFYYKFGNILQQPLREIWNKSERHKYLLSLKKKDFQICGNCDTKEYCSKCPGNALLEKGDFFECSTLDKRLSTITKEMYGTIE